MSESSGVHCVVVTPEKTELDTQCDSINLPMFDGEFGILPGRAPMVGRLGFGIMKLKNGGKEERWFVDGGFVQVTRDAVYILTARLLKPESVNKAAAEEDLRKATELKPTTAQAAALRDRALAQARAKLRVASGA